MLHSERVRMTRWSPWREISASVGASMRWVGPVRSPICRMPSKKPVRSMNTTRSEGRGVVDLAPETHILGRGLEQDGGRERVLAARPEPNRAGIAGAGGHAFAEGAGQDQRVAVEPIGPAFRLGQGETVGDEAERRQVELAQDGGVAPSPAQLQQGAVMGAGDERRAAPNPIHAFGFCQGVDVEEGFPSGGCRRGRRLRRCAATDRGDARHRARCCRGDGRAVTRGGFCQAGRGWPSPPRGRAP